MELFIIRHAAAVPRDKGAEDAARPLTAKGLARWERSVRGLAKLGIEFDRIYHSPWLRAAQTANALTSLLSGESVASVRLAEKPGNLLLTELVGKRVAVVGHEPWLGEMITWLVLGRPEAGRIELGKGAVAWLDGDPKPGAMVLHALLPPKLLRRLGR
jgi:phosphohistidine phosphatase